MIKSMHSCLWLWDSYYHTTLNYKHLKSVKLNVPSGAVSILDLFSGKNWKSPLKNPRHVPVCLAWEKKLHGYMNLRIYSSCISCAHPTHNNLYCIFRLGLYFLSSQKCWSTIWSKHFINTLQLILQTCLSALNSCNTCISQISKHTLVIANVRKCSYTVYIRVSCTQSLDWISRYNFFRLEYCMRPLDVTVTQHAGQMYTYCHIFKNSYYQLGGYFKPIVCLQKDSYH